MTETELANHALGKIGGAGDQINGGAFLSDIDDTDKVSLWCNTNLERVRQKVIIDLAYRKTPFRETIKFYDCGAELDEDDAPEMGQWKYAFNLPGDCLGVVRQFYELYIALRDQYEVNFEVIPNANENGKVILTNTYTNYVSDSDDSSAYIEYVFDQDNTGTYSEALIECIATLMAANLCPLVGKDIEERRRMLAEYQKIAIPEAMAYNQSQFNNHVQTVPNYRGGRNSTIRAL